MMDLEFRERVAALARGIVPEARLLFRASAYGLLAICAFALPISGSWWAGLFLTYMAFNLMVGKIVANISDTLYRLATGQPVDPHFIRWLNFFEQFGDAPKDAYRLYASGLTPRQAWEQICSRSDGDSEASAHAVMASRPVRSKVASWRALARRLDGGSVD